MKMDLDDEYSEYSSASVGVHRSAGEAVAEERHTQGDLVSVSCLECGLVCVEVGWWVMGHVLCGHSSWYSPSTN